MHEQEERVKCGCCQPDPDFAGDIKAEREYNAQKVFDPDPIIDDMIKRRINSDKEQFDSPVAMPVHTYEHTDFESQAHYYAYMTKKGHMRPDVSQLSLFKQYNVEWYSVSYNPQGFLEIDTIEFKDRSIYSKYDGIDMEWMR